MADLMPHQIAAVRTMLNGVDYLADEPGLGKTRTLLATASYGPGPIHVVCPAVVTTHWQREAQILGVADRLRVFSYAGLVGTHANAKARLAALVAPGATLILDEAHYLANQTSQRARVLLSKKGGVVHNPDLARVLFGSGTPMARNPASLWTVVSTCFPHILAEMDVRNYMDWLNETCIWKWVEFGRQRTVKVFGAKDAKRLHQLLTGPVDDHAPMMLRRTERDVGLQLPELWWQWTHVGMPKDIIKAEADLPTHAKLAIQHTNDTSDPAVAALVQSIGIAKATALAPIFAEHAEDDTLGSRVYIAHHRSVLALLRDALPRAITGYIDGDTSAAERQRIIDAFQAGTLTQLVAALGVVQTGITLTRATYIGIVEPGWTADQNIQVAKRIHRIGQRQKCRVELFVGAQSVEQGKLAQVEREIRMLETVVDGGVRPLRTLSPVDELV